MDDKLVTTDERSSDIASYVKKNVVVKINFPIVTVLSSAGSSTFLASVIEELWIIRKKYLEANPIIRIQRWYKNILSKRKKKKLKMK